MTTPSTLFSARQIAELALRKVGAYTINDDSADYQSLVVALDFLELEIANLAGRTKNQWLIQTVEIDLETDVYEYLLSAEKLDYDTQTAAFTAGLVVTGATSNATATILRDDDNGTSGTLTITDRVGTFQNNENLTDTSTGAAVADGTVTTQYPDLGICVPIAAYIVDADGNEDEIELIRFAEYLDRTDKTTPGVPYEVCIDRAANDGKTAFTYPVVEDDTYSLKLSVVTYPRTVRTDLADQQDAGNIDHGLDKTWQKWMMLATACEIGDGPVRQLNDSKLTRLINQRDAVLRELESRQNRETVSKLRRSKRWGG